MLGACPPFGNSIGGTVTKRQEEFEQIAMPHLRSLVRVARRLTRDRAAEDLVQETLLRAWRSFHQFRPGTNERAWLFRILVNAFYAQGRKMKSAPAVIPLLDLDHESSPELQAHAAALENMDVTRALEELSVEHRTVLLLAVVEGFTCEEVAGILSLPIGTVMSRLSRARRALRSRLTPAGERLARTEEV